MTEHSSPTDLQKLQAMPKSKQLAFLALFAGAFQNIMIFRHKDGTVRRPCWGKHECEQVPDWQAFYFRELVDIGFMKPEKLREGTAKGLGDGTEWTFEEWNMQVTEKGFAARESWWSDWRAKVDAMQGERSVSRG